MPENKIPQKRIRQEPSRFSLDISKTANPKESVINSERDGYLPIIQSKFAENRKKSLNQSIINKPELPQIKIRRADQYNQWFIKRQRNVNYFDENPYASGFIIIFTYKNTDRNHFYNNIHNLKEFMQYDPFADQIPQEMKPLVEYSQRIENLREMLRGSKAISEYKKVLDQRGKRIPISILSILEGEDI